MYVTYCLFYVCILTQIVETREKTTAILIDSSFSKTEKLKYKLWRENGRAKTKTESNPIQNYSQHSPHMGNSSKFHIKSIENKAASIHRLKYELSRVTAP